MPSLAALAGRAGDWDWTDMNAAKLRKGTLLGLRPAPNRENNGPVREKTPGRRFNWTGEQKVETASQKQIWFYGINCGFINCTVSVKDGTDLIC